MYWLFIIIAGLGETSGVVMMNEWHRRRHWGAIVGLLLSFGLVCHSYHSAFVISH